MNRYRNIFLMAVVFFGTGVAFFIYLYAMKSHDQHTIRSAERTIYRSSNYKTLDSINIEGPNSAAYQTVTPNRMFTIGLYNTNHGGIFQRGHFQKCYRYKNCKVVELNMSTTYDNYLDADAIVMETGLDSITKPKHRDTNQVFIFVAVESMVSKTYRAFDVGGNYYNWTMTYRADSSIPLMYGSIVSKSFYLQEKQTDEYVIENGKLINSIIDRNLNSTYILDTYSYPNGIAGKNYSAIFNDKEYSVLWIVSHCGASSKRDQYVQELQKYIDVHILGRCGTPDSRCPKHINNTREGNRFCYSMYQTKYKFYLSFENSICRDYITEKVFRWFDLDIVNVVRGARNYENHLPKGTYIDSKDFTSPKELADYLHKVGSDETKYINILKRKDGYKVLTRGDQNHLALCHLCYKLNNLEQHRHVVANISKWWRENICVRGEEITDLS